MRPSVILSPLRFPVSFRPRLLDPPVSAVGAPTSRDCLSEGIRPDESLGLVQLFREGERIVDFEESNLRNPSPQMGGLSSRIGSSFSNGFGADAISDHGPDDDEES